MAGNVIKAYYDKDNNTAHVVKNSKYGTFHCTATPHYNEKTSSELTGFQIAELKCDLQIQRAKASAYNQRAIGIKHAYTILQNKYSTDEPIMKKIERTLKIAQRDADNAYNTYKYNKDIKFPQLIENINTYRYNLHKKILEREQDV